MSINIIPLVRWLILLRHPRLSYWYWKVDVDRKLPNPANPRTVNEKFFWRKIFDRYPELTKVSDKLRVRDWLQENRIDIDAPKIIWSGDNAADIPDAILANGVVAKANHGSGTNMILGEAPENRAAFNRRMRRYKRKPQGRKRLEWAYFGISRKIMVEELIPNINIEFKSYTYGEKVAMLVIIYDRFEDICADVWEPNENGDWGLVDRTAAVGRRAKRPFPDIAAEALKISSQIGGHFDQMRVDILSDGHKLWFSELTIYNMAGYLPGLGSDPDNSHNTSWDILQSWFMRTPQKGWKRIYANQLRESVMANHKTSVVEGDT